jgi:hypothetical protein
MSAGLACGIVCGLIFVVAPFRPPIRSQIHVVRVAYWLAGACFILWGASGLLGSVQSLSPSTRYFLRFVEPRFGAAGFGLILLLALSGYLFRRAPRT